MSSLDKKRENFRFLLNKLKVLSPNSDLSQYENYYKWNSEKLDANAELIKNKITKIKNKSGKRHEPVKTDNAQKEQFSIERERESFKYLLAELRYLKPDSDTSQYDNYYKWNYEKLLRNAELVRSSIDKCRRKKYF